MSLRRPLRSLPPLWQAILPGVLLTIGAAWAFVGILDAVTEQDDVSQWDQPLVDWFVSIRAPWLTEVFTAITALFSPVVLPIIVAVGCGIWVGVTKRLRAPLLLVGAMVVSTAVSVIVKLGVQRARPDPAVQVVPGFESSFSFPSGHTTGAATLVLVTGYLLWRTGGGKRRLARWLAGSAVVIVLVAASRLYLGYHFLSDVLAGACLGLFTLGLVVTASRLLALKRPAAARSTH